MTIEEFAVKVLMKMRVHDSGSQVDPVDLQNVSDAYDAVYQTLLDEGLVTWAATDDIPIRFSLPLIDLVAGQIKPFYGGQLNTAELLPIIEQPAAKTLRRQLTAPYVPEPTEAEYF